MKNSIKRELIEHITYKINDGIITNDNNEDWHFHCFNEDYYLIGYYVCSNWLKSHEFGEFEAAAICQEYEKEMFGEITTIYDNSESVVNMLAYIYGEVILSEIDAHTIEELEEKLEEIKN